MSINKLFLSVLALLLIVPGIASASDYIVVVSRETREDPGWNRVVKALVANHEGAAVVSYDKHVEESLDALRERHPRYTCFVATPTEAGRQFVADVHRLTRRLDEDPYTDTLWGVLTGYDSDNALRIAKHKVPAHRP